MSDNRNYTREKYVYLKGFEHFKTVGTCKIYESRCSICGFSVFYPLYPPVKVSCFNCHAVHVNAPSIVSGMVVDD